MSIYGSLKPLAWLSFQSHYIRKKKPKTTLILWWFLIGTVYPPSPAPLVNRMQPLGRTLLSIAASLRWQLKELFCHSFPNGNSIINGARSLVWSSDHLSINEPLSVRAPSFLFDHIPSLIPSTFFPPPPSLTTGEAKEFKRSKHRPKNSSC
jgi:hypothetical protein